MSRKKIWRVGACMFLLAVGYAQAFVGLAVRVGCAYVGYKFVDGVTDCAISSFVDQYQSGVADAICSFGKGVQIFGSGVRAVAVDFWYDNSNDAFSRAWKGVTDQFGSSVVAMQAEWDARRSGVASNKIKRVVCESGVEQQEKEKIPSVAHKKQEETLKVIV